MTIRRGSLVVALVVVFATAGCGSNRPPSVDLTNRWPVSTPGREAMDAALLMRADGLARSRRFPNVVALLVARHGRIVFERYYRGYSATAPLDLFSITKSVTSAAFGVALADGNIRSVDQPLGDFLPHGLAGASARVRHLTLRELLTMSSGFPSDPSDVAPAFTVAAHPLQALLARPFTSSQGRFAYDSGSAQLVADVVGRA